MVAFDQVPRLVLDATTTAEDRTFWENSGFDAAAIAAAAAQDANGDSERGASTITQQLVRARLLRRSDRTRRRHLLAQGQGDHPVIQAVGGVPGRAGKDRIITAYLNEIFYGHDAYGIAAAARVYFGQRPRPADAPQAALLAGLPKSPTMLDPYRYAKKDSKGRLVVPANSPPVVRADWVLGGLASGPAGPRCRRTSYRHSSRRRRPRRRPAADAARRAVHLAGQDAARRHPRRPGRERRRDRGLHGHHDPRLEGAAARREVAGRRRHRSQPVAREGRRPAQEPQDPGERPAVDPCPARQGPARRRAGRDGLHDRRRPGLRRQRRLRPRRPRQREVPAQVRRRRRRLPAAGLGVEADLCTPARSTATS